MSLSKIILETYLQSVMALSGCALKRVCNLKWAYIAGKLFPSVIHTASAEKANVYQELKLIESVNYFRELS